MSTNSQENDALKAVIVPVKLAGEIEAGVRFRYAMKVELGLPVDDLRDNWAALETAYFVERTAQGGAQWFLARIDGNFVGSACAFVDDAWFTRLAVRPRSGWIIGVYVLPAVRHRGLARALTDATLRWLRAAGCVEAKLHASPFGRGLYESMGFTLSNEMTLTL